MKTSAHRNSSGNSDMMVPVRRPATIVESQLEPTAMSLERLAKPATKSTRPPKPREPALLHLNGRHPLLQLQRNLGNRRVGELIQAKRITREGRLVPAPPKATAGNANLTERLGRPLSVPVQRQPEGEGPHDAGVPVAAGVPEPKAPKDFPDDELGWQYEEALKDNNPDRAAALDQEMEKRFPDWGTAIPRGPEPVVGGSGAVAPDVALNLLNNMAAGEAPFKPELGLGGASWFTTEGAPYTSVNADKSIRVPVEIQKGSDPLIFREADLQKILTEERDTTRQIAEKEYREKFKIPDEVPLSNTALKKIARTLDRFNEKRMWIKVGEKVAASAQKAGEVILEPGSRFSDAPGRFAVIADAKKVTLKGGTGAVVEALENEGVSAEPVVVEAAEALAKRLKWVGRVRTAFRYGGHILIVVAVAADLYQIYRAKDKLKAIVTVAGGWAGATAAGAAFGAWFTPADAAGPWAWAAHGVGTLIAGGIGYWVGSKTTRYIYELALE